MPFELENFSTDVTHQITRHMSPLNILEMSFCNSDWRELMKTFKFRIKSLYVNVKGLNQEPSCGLAAITLGVQLWKRGYMHFFFYRKTQEEIENQIVLGERTVHRSFGGNQFKCKIDSTSYKVYTTEPVGAFKNVLADMFEMFPGSIDHLSLGHVEESADHVIFHVLNNPLVGRCNSLSIPSGCGISSRLLRYVLAMDGLRQLYLNASTPVNFKLHRNINICHVTLPYGAWITRSSLMLLNVESIYMGDARVNLTDLNELIHAWLKSDRKKLLRVSFSYSRGCPWELEKRSKRDLYDGLDVKTWDEVKSTRPRYFEYEELNKKIDCSMGMDITRSDGALATINSTRDNVDFVDHDPIENGAEDEQLTQFRVVSEIHAELIEFVKTKLSESIELQTFEVDREIEFMEKKITRLNRSETPTFNNHNEQEEREDWELTTEERAAQLQQTERRLNGLRRRRDNLFCRVQKALDSLNCDGLEQVRIVNGRCNVDLSKFHVKNEAWICALNTSLGLKKIKLICDKISVLEVGREATFWFDEVKGLLEKLEENEKQIALGLIVEMAFWKSETTIEVDNLYVDLMYSLFDNAFYKETIGKGFQQVPFSQSGIEHELVSLKVISVFLKTIKQEDRESLEQFTGYLSSSLLRTLNNVHLETHHMNSVITVIEGIEQQLISTSDQFDRVLTTFGQKIGCFEGSLRHQMTGILRRFRPSVSPVPDQTAHVPVLMAAISETLSVRHFTVTEHSSVASGLNDTMETQRRLEERRRVEEENRNKETEELRKEVERLRLAAEEEKKRKNELARLEEVRRQEEENKKELERKKEEENRKQKELEEAIRRQVEEEYRKQVKEREQQETERKNKEAEDVKKRADEEKQRKKAEVEEYKRANPCTFLRNVRLFLHTCPQKVYNESVLNGKIIGLYFSGYWCPPSRAFTPVLKNFYSQVDVHGFEIVYFSQDNTLAEMQLYLQEHHGNWFNAEFGSNLGDLLYNQLGCTGIPTLIIIKPNGTVISSKGREEVTNCTNPIALLDIWKSGRGWL
ncbi:unnamed protein product [Caenorhabditis sp. 36 PRJEB53466]|nr:unnamed protein product [Caenorhabditis sp. 36 PRJEB53466]